MIDVNITEAPYNAVGDGVADDQPAIQSAIDDAITAGGGVVDANTIRIMPLTASGTYVATAAMSSTVPWTWANGDIFSIRGTYEAA